MTLPHTLSQQLKLHSSAGDERRPLLSSTTFSEPITRDANNTISSRRDGGTDRMPSISFNDTDNEFEDEDQHADSDGLFPPHCSFTAAEPRPPGQHDRADPFGTKECKVYLNIHRYAFPYPSAVDHTHRVVETTTTSPDAHS